MALALVIAAAREARAAAAEKTVGRDTVVLAMAAAAEPAIAAPTAAPRDPAPAAQKAAAAQPAAGPQAAVFVAQSLTIKEEGGA